MPKYDAPRAMRSMEAAYHDKSYQCVCALVSKWGRHDLNQIEPQTTRRIYYKRMVLRA